jgi:hypothetical protein
MKRFALAAAALMAFSAVPASAQYYGNPYGGYDPGYDSGYEPAPRRTYRVAPREYDPYGGRTYYSPRPRYRQVQLGSVCVTSRGSCESSAAPIQAKCRCYIPGFGPKRGNIEY